MHAGFGVIEVEKLVTIAGVQIIKLAKRVVESEKWLIIFAKQKVKVEM